VRSGGPGQLHIVLGTRERFSVLESVPGETFCEPSIYLSNNLQE
jgi:hypothetical protein